MDSGSNITAIQYEFLKSLPTFKDLRIEHTSLNFRTAVAGRSHHVKGKISLPIIIEGRKIDYTFYVITDLLHNVLLGVDFFNDYNAFINFRNRTFSIPNIFKTNIHDNYSMALVANKSIKLPGRMIKKIPVHVGNALKGMNLIISGNNDYCSSDIIARNFPGKTFMLPLINNSEEKGVIMKGSIIANIEKISNNQQSFQLKTNNNPLTLQNQKIDAKFFDIGKKYKSNDDLLKVLTAYQDLFSDKDSDIGEVRDFECTIELLPNSMPIRAKPYPLNPHMRKVEEEQIQKLLDKGIIEPSTSNFSSPVVIVKKKKKNENDKQEYRMCIDYRLLNKISKKMYFQLPTLEDVKNVISNAKPVIYSVFDIKEAYHTLRLSEDSKQYSAFTSSSGDTYMYKRLPFGHITSSYYWCTYLNKILRKFLYKFCIAYMDDIIVYSSSIEEHIEHLKQIFKALTDANLRLNLKKSEIAKSKVSFLGMVFEGDTLKIDPKKLQIIKDFKIPQNQKALKSFLGMTTFLRRFIKNYAKVSAPLNNLLRKDTIYKWTEEHDKAFSQLKSELASEPILKLPDFNKPFVLFTDASSIAVSYILCQNDSETGKLHTIQYGGRSIQKDMKYSSSELELFAIIFALRDCKHFLWNVPIKIVTDNKALTYLHTMKHTNGRLYRWAIELENFEYEIVYGKGINNPADYLSRLNHKTVFKTEIDAETALCDIKGLFKNEKNDNKQKTVHVSVITRNQKKMLDKVNTDDSLSIPSNQDNEIRNNTDDLAVNADDVLNTDNNDNGDDAIHNKTINFDLSECQRDCPDFKDIYAYLNKGELPENPKIAKKIVYESEQYQMDDGILFHFYEPRRNKNNLKQPIKQLALPKLLRNDILLSFHDTAHFGVDKTFYTIKQFYYWPKMYQDVKVYVMSCTSCQINKRDYNFKPAPLKEMPIPSEPWEVVHVDIITVAKESKGYKYVLSVICAFSKYAIFLPLHTQNAEEIAENLFHKVFSILGPPKTLISDRGQNFIGNIMQILYKFFGIQKKNTSSFHPMTNGQVENVQRTLLSMLRTTLTNEKDWPDKLSSVQIAYNSTVCPDTTQFSPYHILFGRHMNLPINTILFEKKTRDCKPNVQYYVNELTDRLKLIWELCNTNLADSKQQMTKQYNKKSKQRIFRLGDLVLLKQNQIPADMSRKLYRKFSNDIYYIAKVLPFNTFVLRNRSTNKEIKSPVHINRLKEYIDPKDYRGLNEWSLINDESQHDVTEQNKNTTENISQSIDHVNDTNTQNNGNDKPTSEKKWYRAKCVLKSKIIDNERYFLVKWANKKYKNSWVKHADVSEALIRQFYIGKTKNNKRRQDLK